MNSDQECTTPVAQDQFSIVFEYCFKVLVLYHTLDALGKSLLRNIVDFSAFLQCFLPFNSLPYDKILKIYADDKINVNEEFKFGLGRVENIVKKGENAGFQLFLLFQQCFQKSSVSGSLKVWIVW